MERILRGIMRYRVLDRASMVKQFQEVKNNPIPKAVFYTCMDSRMIPTRFTETSVGDMFVGTKTNIAIKVLAMYAQ
ncbi:beta carbonic anhydrase 1 isoform X2 [Galleria mellonella]|uniref:carbonic anhydrase n=1 Tax=Galleria mellonella TaxID=7137 RepID=A0ABM3MRQ3_GALME|nr:beta carbonic anhydrase 1 isoform X2 [Galleria mellonella]